MKPKLWNSLQKLGEKYAVSIPETWENEPLPLFPWRMERRFVELRNLIQEKTVEEVVLGRFSCNVQKGYKTLREVLFRELDLGRWMLGTDLEGLYAAITELESGESFANVLVRWTNGVVCSIEAGTTLKKGASRPFLDRHEWVGRRGVASDRVVDTQIPQESVYVYTSETTQHFTDTDAELFGLEENEIAWVRSAWELAQNPSLRETWQRQQEQLHAWVDLALTSASEKQYRTMGGAT
ncbi:MAG: hypothetical protein Q4D62_03175 [Planctomycetia bacterium]|nr:hypothetical protein [Planctomycetia bacterium]